MPRHKPVWLRNKIKAKRRTDAIARSAIPQSAVRAFVARPRRDFRCFTRYSLARLEKLAATLPIRPPIWKKLRINQKSCLIIGARERRFFYMNDTGTGKTLLIGAIAEYFYELGDLDHLLVQVPRKPNKEEWRDELHKHLPGFPVVVLEGSTENKWQQMLDNPDALLFVDTYAGFMHLACSLKKSKKKEKNEFVPNQTKLKKLRAFFQGVVSDEGVQGGLGNKDSLPWRICRQLTKRDEDFYFTLTGTPFGREPILMWPQMWLVDHGYSLGENQALFRATFYSQTINPFGGIEYTYLKKKKPLLHEFIADASIRFEADAADLPKVNHIPKYCSLPEDAEDYYEKAKRLLLSKHGNYEEQKNAFLRMRQISSGFMGFKDDETGEKAKFEFDENPKLDLLLTWVKGISDEYKQIIFYEYTFSGLKIVSELKKLGIKPLHMYGKTKDVGKEKWLFNNDPDFPVLVIQNTFGVGLNIQIAKYGAFYEAPVSPITRKQCWRRIERQESPHKSVFIADMIMRGTLDERILDFHKEGDDLFKGIIQGKVKL